MTSAEIRKHYTTLYISFKLNIFPLFRTSPLLAMFALAKADGMYEANMQALDVIEQMQQTFMNQNLQAQEFFEMLAKRLEEAELLVTRLNSNENTDVVQADAGAYLQKYYGEKL